MNPEPTTNQESSLFENEMVYTRAGTGKRFLNFLIDLVVYYVLFIIVVYIAVNLYAPIANYIVAEKGTVSPVMSLAGLTIYILYMGFAEAVLNGRSIGKLITNTRAVNLDGTRISFKTAFLRSLSRAVPFSSFSALNTPCDPWQDRWTKTMVIDQRKS